MEYVNGVSLQKIKLKRRALDISDGRDYFLCGPPRSGKSMLALRRASNLKNTLYIDLDMHKGSRLIEKVRSMLLKSVLEKSVELIIIDNFYRGFVEDFDFDIQTILIGDVGHYISGFTRLRVSALNFEEYSNFETRASSVEQTLSNFIKDGNSPGIHLLPDLVKGKYKLDGLRLCLGNDFQVFFHIIPFQGKSTSILAIYNHLKEHILISKDRLYKIIKKLEQNGICHFCRHISNENSIKKAKLYFYDFSLHEFSGHKNFKTVFENMVFLELISLGFELNYDSTFDFIDVHRNVSFLCMPFSSIQMIKTKMKVINRTNSTTVVISMNLRKETDNCKVVDFANIRNIKNEPKAG